MNHVVIRDLPADVCEETRLAEQSPPECQVVGEVSVVTDLETVRHPDNAGLQWQTFRTTAVGRQHADEMPAPRQGSRDFINNSGGSTVMKSRIKVRDYESDSHQESRIYSNI